MRKLVHVLFWLDMTKHMSYDYSEMLRCCTLSIKQHNPNVDVWFWTNVRDISTHPELSKLSGLVTFKHCDPPKEFKDQSLETFQAASDVARTDILLEHGGCYIDIDAYVTRSFEHLFDSKKPVLMLDVRGRYQSWFIFVDKGSQLIIDWRDEMKNTFMSEHSQRSIKNKDAYVWALRALTTIATKHDHVLIPAKAFNSPGGWMGKVKQFFLTYDFIPHVETYGHHLSLSGRDKEKHRYFAPGIRPGYFNDLAAVTLKRREI